MKHLLPVGLLLWSFLTGHGLQSNHSLSNLAREQLHPSGSMTVEKIPLGMKSLIDL